jgi:hypothetical protein
MKVIIPTLIVTASASLTEMENLFSKIISNATGPNDRAFADNQFSLSLSQASSYGCWCHDLAVHTGKGKSKPIDELDSLCKRLSDGYDCAAIDAEARNETCAAWEENYTNEDGDAIDCGSMQTQKDVDALGLSDLIIQSLGINVVSECKKQACQIEQDFVNKVAKLFLHNPDARNANLAHDSDNFDSETECPSKKCEGEHCDGVKQCCGSVPGRRTYKDKSDEGDKRKCCGQTVYLDTVMECCADGETTAAFGTCP